MRLLILFLLAGFLHVSAAGNAQTITLKGKKLPLEAVLQAIRQQTDYTVFGAGSILVGTHPVTVDARQMPLADFLNTIFRDQPLEAKVEDKTIILSRKSTPLVIPNSLILAYPEVRGRVRDSVGHPLEGASIRVLNAEGKRTTLQTTTDRQGEFLLHNVPEDATLEITFVGYISQKVSAVANIGTIVLKALSSELEEVSVMVNTGYQQIPKERATGSFEVVSQKALSQRVSTDIWRRLEGVSSVLFDEAYTNTIRPNHTIRGISSINGLKDPLVVVDNFPFEGNINTLNPNDVESVTILKDAAAASIWGSRAGNGVIVITTKRAKRNTPFHLNYSSNVQLVSKPDVDYLKWIKSKDIIDIEKILYANGFESSFFTSVSKPYISPVYELLRQQELGQVDASYVDAELDKLAQYDIKDQYDRYYLQKGTNQQHYLTASGGTDKASYLLSGGYDRNVGNLDERYQRLTLKSVNTFRPIKNLMVDLQLNYNRSKDKTGRTALGSLTGTAWFSNYAHFVDLDGNESPLYLNRQSYLDTVGNGKLLDWKFYPLSNYQHDYYETIIENIRPYMQLKYDLPLHLSAQVQYQYERQRQERIHMQDEDSYYTRNLINQFTQIDSNTGNVTRNVPLGGIVDRSYTNLFSHNVRGQLNYNQQFGDHDVNALAGAELRDIRGRSNGYRVYGYDDEVKTVGKADVVNPYKNFITGANAYIPANTSEGGTLNRYVSLFANAAYTYKKRYTLSGSMRRDASNLFGVNTNEKWQPMWSMGASWNLSDEAFYHSDWLPYLKMRATYGYSGNVDTRKSGVTTLRYSAIAQYTNYRTATFSQYANPQLKWETIRTTNLGVDFRLKNDLLSGSLEYYVKKGDDLFGNSLIDYTAGLGTNYVTRNVANTATKGVDLNLASEVFHTHDFSWNSNLLFSFNKGKVTKYLYEHTYLSYYISMMPLVEGKPIYAMYSYRSAGLNAEGKPQGYLNGQPSTAYSDIMYGTDLSGLEYNGPIIPQWYGGWTNTFLWKEFALTINATYKLNYYFSRSSFNNYSTIANLYGHADYYERWQQPGDEQTTRIPAFVYPYDSSADSFYGSSSDLVEKGDHVRLQYMDLSYTIQKSKLQRFPFQSLQLRANVTNLGILWRANEHDLDPDLIGSNLPSPRTLTFGINVNL
ncbi:SusC/RagA family TonB-linked outer membrane protein [Olivibacter sitiensis]|uniref:SusC/RagA family TonB-linked outer membrane protein n=1 Tax=Olivibacter sitiensis TaxID=376470 RepID=UPI00040BD39A|nr:SusC/RagA family TonB-linked outer membrane protein [Olivibacter sitiensis]